MHTSKESADKPVLFLITDNYCTLEEDSRSKQSGDGGRVGGWGVVELCSRHSNFQLLFWWTKKKFILSSPHR